MNSHDDTDRTEEHARPPHRARLIAVLTLVIIFGAACAPAKTGPPPPRWTVAPPCYWGDDICLYDYEHRLHQAADAGDVAAIEVVITRRFGQLQPARSKAECESSMRPWAIGPPSREGPPKGLFQIKSPLHDGVYRALGYDPARAWRTAGANTHVAHELSRGGTDWSAWAC